MDKHELELPSTPAFHEERNRLSSDQQAVFEDLVNWYRYYGLIHYRQPFVSYKILADLVRMGWRLVRPNDSDRKSE